MNQPFGIHWFRRDLRVFGNPGLQKCFSEYGGRVVGIFCFDSKFLSRSDFSVNRFQFFLSSMKRLKEDLQRLGSDLLVLDIGPDEGFDLLIKTLKKQNRYQLGKVTFCRDYEPFARKRDERLTDYFMKNGIDVETFRDHLIIEPWELAKEDGEPYKVFSPFQRKWLELCEEKGYWSRVEQEKSSLLKWRKYVDKGPEKIFKLDWTEIFGSMCPEDHLDKYWEKNKKKVSIAIPNGDHRDLLSRLKSFSSLIKNYSNRRDIPSVDGTSQFSMYFKNGSLTSAMALSALNVSLYQKKAKTDQDKWLSEIIWREFYYHILYHYPDVEKNSFIPEFDLIVWENNSEYFQAWKEGKTGYPIVDAGMRQLIKTGWMHNRVRMVVASFLTKDLLIDWRWGERHFMELLLDGDLAPNNGGWQWAASTGCDPQPYFRIFNPWLQSQKFDPDGKYIKEYIPELRDLPAKQLHRPIENHPSYPHPIVDHRLQRMKALELYQSAKKVRP